MTARERLAVFIAALTAKYSIEEREKMCSAIEEYLDEIERDANFVKELQ